MRTIMLGLGLAFLLPTAALAQMGGMGGGMGGMGTGGMGRGMGGMGGGGMMGAGSMDGERGGGPGQSGMRSPQHKPLRRDRLDKPVETMFQQADVDRDGLVTLDELRGVLTARRDTTIRARFDRIDTNRNKTIELGEFIAWQSALGSAATDDRQALGQDAGPISESIAPPLGNDGEDRVLRRIIEPLSATVITDANSNYDRGLSLSELLTYERQKFDALDGNKDGFLVMEELHATEPNGRGGRGPGMGRQGMGQ